MGSFGSFGDSFSRKQLQHVPYVRGPRRISKYRRLQIFRRQPVADREAEQIDDLFGMGPDEVSAQDAICVLLDEGLEAVDRFVESSGCVPVRSRLRVHSEFDPLRARLRLAEPNRGNWRNCECDARNAPVVRPVLVAVEKVLRDDFAIVARYRRERRAAACGVTCGINLGNSLSFTRPFSVATPPVARSSAARSGSRPAACTTRSAATSCSCPSVKACTKKPPTVLSIRCTVVRVRTSMPRSPNFSMSQPTRSGSNAGSIRSARWSTVTWTPARAVMCENSAAM